MVEQLHYESYRVTAGGCSRLALREIISSGFDYPDIG